MSIITYTDGDGRTLQTGICEDPAHMFLRVTEGGVVAEVCISKGDPAAPLILERPDGQVAGSALAGLRYAVRGQEIEAADRSGALFTYSPDQVRSHGIALVMLAEQAACEPDAADVQALADEMYSEVRRIGGSPPEEWRIAARAALRWMKKREAS